MRAKRSQHWRRRRPTRALLLSLALACCITSTAFTSSAFAQAPTDPYFDEIQAKAEITPHLGAKLPLERVFRDEAGATVKLGDYFGGDRPVLLTFVYYTCPRLCNFQMSGLLNGLRELEYRPGQEFEVVVLSIDPRDKPEHAAARKPVLLKEYGVSGTDAGWHLLTGEEAEIRAVADAMGFGYVWAEQYQEYVHKAGAFFVTPDGTLSRFLGGIAYEPATLQKAVLEASDGKVGSVWDHVSMLCINFDPNTGAYTANAILLSQVGGGITVLGVAFFLFLVRRGRRQASRVPTATTDPERPHVAVGMDS